MASLGSDVQATSVELVAVIEDMRERKAELDELIEADEAERLQVLAEINHLQNRLAALDAGLQQKTKARNDLDRTITDTCSTFKNILDSSRKLLSTAREESTRIQTAPGTEN